MLGACFGGLGVAAGAFGAHALKSVLSAEMLAVYETAARYQMYHALALLAVGLLINQVPDKGYQKAGWLFLIGIVLFCGSLYVLALSGVGWLGAVTPLGGLAWIGGWSMVGWTVWKKGR